MGFGMLLFLTQQTYTVKLNAELRLGWVAALELIRQLVLSGTFIALVIAGAGVVWFFGATVASGVVVLTLTILVVRGDASCGRSGTATRRSGFCARCCPTPWRRAWGSCTSASR